MFEKELPPARVDTREEYVCILTEEGRRVWQPRSSPLDFRNALTVWCGSAGVQFYRAVDYPPGTVLIRDVRTEVLLHGDDS